VSLAGARALVTGAGGFLGSHLVERLLAAGARPRAFVRYGSTGSRGWLEGSPRLGEIEVFAGDVTDAGSVRRAMEGVDVVFHLAALIGIPYSYHAPLSYVRTNVEGTLNVCQAALDAGVRRLVHTSTSEVYGTALRVPIDEEHPLQGQSPYSASKIAADKIAESFHRSFGLPVVTVRPFNTYGPRQSARAIVPAIVTQLLRGPAVRLGNLAPTRDMNYVSDTVEGFLRAAESDGAEGRVVQLGSGREIAIGDLARLVARLLGRPIELREEAVRLRPGASEVERLLCDASRARQLLGWTPAVALEEGLRRTIDWIASNRERYRHDGYVV